MPVLVQSRVNFFHEIEKKLKYRFWDKERERSNHAVRLQEAGVIRPRCKHERTAWSGPPHDIVQCITCLDCQSFVTEPEMKDRGFDFENCPDFVFHAIMDERAKRQVRSQP
jgi:hypothetical protein